MNRRPIALLLALLPALSALEGCATHATASATSPTSSATASGDAPATGSNESAEDRHSRHMARTTGWIATSIGAGAGILALGTSILMLKDKGDRDSNCSDKVCNPNGITANSQLSDLGPWNAAVWVVAAAGLGAGAFLLFTNPADDGRSTQVGVTPGGLSLRSTF